MKMDTVCLECLLHKYIPIARANADEEHATAFAHDLMREILAAPDWAAAPYLQPKIAQLFVDHCGLPYDRFRQEKEESNRFVLERLDAIRSTVESAEDTILAGLQIAILGNYIDFSALLGEVDFDRLDEMLASSRQIHVDETAFARLTADLERAKRLLYITDNAGEIGFDRVFAEAIHKKYPDVDITFCVRGGPALNDATREDAQVVGIPFRLMDSGTKTPGTLWQIANDQLREALENSDVIIAKGQGNVETMLGCGYNVYYAFLVKCKRFQREFNAPKLAPMLLPERG